ncbi:hypothetical protein tb265_49990 [Gemmatimonadetes bacterium T265]|nr:hypothetical protein tb265_49990 [Gemmatimonadetes bacterium T265]
MTPGRDSRLEAIVHPAYAIAVAAVVAAGLVTSPLLAQGPDCGAVLIPAVDKGSTSRNARAAYVRTNAREEYERLSRMSASQRHADASYELFGADYDESSSASDFEDRVKKSFQQQTGEQDEAAARTWYTSRLTTDQVNAWLGCQTNGGLLLVPSGISHSGLSLKVVWKPGPGIGTTHVVITAPGGLVNGKSLENLSLTGAASQVVNVSISDPANVSVVRLLANALEAAMAADLVVDFTPRRTMSFETAQVQQLITFCSDGSCPAGKSQVYSFPQSVNQFYTLCGFGGPVTAVSIAAPLAPNGTPGYKGHLDVFPSDRHGCVNVYGALLAGVPPTAATVSADVARVKTELVSLYP